MTQSVQGGVTFYKLRNGSSAAASLSVDNQLTQIVAVDASGAATVAPDWTVAANQPTITAAVGGYSLTDINWYYNGDLITSANASFDISIPGKLKIIKNLASASNLASDIITFKAQMVDNSGSYAGDVEKSIEVLILKASNNGYTTVINPSASVLSEATPNATLTAKVFQGTTDVTDQCTYKWFKGTGTTEWKTGKSITIDRSNVDGYQLFVCRAYGSTGNELDTEGITIHDVADDYDVYMTVVANGNTTDNVQERYGVDEKAASATATPHLVIGTARTEKTGLTWKLQKLHSETMKLIAEISGSTTQTSDTDTEDAYNTINGTSITIYDKDYISNTTQGGLKAMEVQVTCSTEF